MIKLNQSTNGFTVTEGLIILAVFSILGVASWNFWKVHSQIGLNSSVCLIWVKRIEGSNYSNINKLNCSLEPRKIGNSNLIAKYLNYSGEAKGGCPIDPGISGQSAPPGCTGWSGIVLSNGKTYPGVGDGQVQVPSRLDYCYDRMLENSPHADPTSHDLYFYQGDLYDRDVFNNVDIKTPYGTCVLNGTTIYHPDMNNGFNESYISNVTVQYKDFPNDCSTITLGRTADDELTCIDYVTAANANLNSCYSNQTPIVVNGQITGFKSEPELYVGQYINGDCRSVYVESMAALNKCSDAVIDNFNDGGTTVSCSSWVSHPAFDTTRVSTVI